MQKADVVGGSHSCAEVARDPQCVFVLKSAVLPKQRRQILSGDVFHRNKMATLRLDNVIDTTDVRVSDLTAVANFVVKTPDEFFVRHCRGRKKFERYLL